MIKCMAVYPFECNDSYKKRLHNTIKLAKQYCFDEVFSTIHLPEMTLDEQLSALEIISKETKFHDLTLTIDIGGYFIDEILKDNTKQETLKNIPIDFIRLDYGYDMNQVSALYSLLNLKGFVINASIYSKSEFKEIVKAFNELDPKIELRACHNYYVRTETGLDSETAKIQDSYLKEYDIPIYYCVPMHKYPRGPIYEGLCTLEKHRYQSLSMIIADLVLNYDCKAIMLADEWPEEEDFEEVKNTLELLDKPLDKIEKILVKFLDTASEKERKIVLQAHSIRYDSPNQFLRSQSSRQMAEFAESIEENNCIERKAGTITIDNHLNKRYSGELQIITMDALKDEKVNVVAEIVNQNDLIKLLRHKEGISYEFMEVFKDEG